jgi:phosphocarrier protein FPr
VADAAAAVQNGADLAGLVRTEFLFLGRDDAPSVDEQEAAYRSVSGALAGRPAVFRTLDVGGDKPLSYVDQPAEANPFLGLRGLRLALARPQLLRDQLTALCRVAAEHPVSVMFPMVTHLAELLAAREILDGVGPPAGLDVGMMIEVPAAALKAAAFVPHVDFFSIGTNDLTQYTLAAERGNDSVAAGADPLDPAVLRLIDAVCRAVAGQNVRVAVCGEMAADPVAVPLLVGIGVDELSVAPYSVPQTKQTVRGLTAYRCRELASRALSLPAAADVRELVAGC